MGRYDSYGDWAPYIPVGEKKRLALKEAKRGLKKGQLLEPVEISGRRITKNFWGNAWCENLTQYSDFSNRLPRGRTYVCNGSVVDLRIDEGKVVAIVAGSEPYKVKISIKKLDGKIWKRLCNDCATRFTASSI